jgi:hypothetical protein
VCGRRIDNLNANLHRWEGLKARTRSTNSNTKEKKIRLAMKINLVDGSPLNLSSLMTMAAGA